MHSPKDFSSNIIHHNRSISISFAWKEGYHQDLKLSNQEILLFQRSFIFQEELKEGKEEATCPSCSLVVKVVYDLVRIVYIQLVINYKLNCHLLQEKFNTVDEEVAKNTKKTETKVVATL
jgi:hypothetical protein